MRIPAKIVIVGVFVAGLLAPAHAQRGGGERSGPAQPPLWLRDEEYLRWPLAPGEEAYAKLDAHRIKGYIDDITAISRKSRDDGNQYWGRITGTPYDKMTSDWIAAQFRRVGLEQVRVQEFTNLPPQWFPTSWEVIAAGTEKAVPLKTTFPIYHTASTSALRWEP